MSIELAAEIEPVAAASEIRDGWRGLLDFGEKWTQDDADLWAPEWGELPLGEPLTYGCEVSRDSGNARRVAIRLLVVDHQRKVMKQGLRSYFETAAPRGPPARSCSPDASRTFRRLLGTEAAR